MMQNSRLQSRRRASIFRCLLVAGLAYWAQAQTASAQTWTLAWSDEFNGPVGPPSTATWNFDLGNNGGWGNNELEVYCGPPGYPNNPPQCPTTFSAASSNAYVDGSGHLVIQAINSGGTWTSTRMNTNTNPQKTFQYGRIEAGEKLPVGAGLWPAFWALGSNIATVSWPTCGEMDFMENVPAGPPGNMGPGIIQSTIHGPGYSGGSGLGQRYTFPSGDVTGFHTYGLIWSPFMVEFYVDDPANVFFIRTASDTPAKTVWAFNHPFFILTNLAVGGNFPGPPNSSTPSTAQMLVDYVRYYQASPITPPIFGSAPAINVKVGGIGSSTISLTGTPGSGRVYLACSSMNTTVGCNVNTGFALNSSVVDFTSSASATALVNVTTTANSTTLPFFLDLMLRHFGLPALGALMALLLSALLALNGKIQPRRRRAALAAFVLSAFLIASCGGGGSSASGCGSGGMPCSPPSGNGTPPGTYTVTVNAYTVSGSGATPDASANITLNVTN